MKGIENSLPAVFAYEMSKHPLASSLAECSHVGWTSLSVLHGGTNAAWERAG
jgi:hypothetical protein